MLVEIKPWLFGPARTLPLRYFLAMIMFQISCFPSHENIFDGHNIHNFMKPYMSIIEAFLEKEERAVSFACLAKDM